MASGSDLLKLTRQFSVQGIMMATHYDLKQLVVILICTIISLPAVSEDVHKGDWVFQIFSDPFTDEKTVTLAAFEDVGGYSSTPSSIGFSCKINKHGKNELDVIWFDSSELLPFSSFNERKYVTLFRFDKGPIEKWGNWISTSETSDIIYKVIDDYDIKFSTFLNDMRRHNRLAFRTHDANGNELTVFFDLAHSAEMIGMYEAVCDNL